MSSCIFGRDWDSYSPPPIKQLSLEADLKENALKNITQGAMKQK